MRFRLTALLLALALLLTGCVLPSAGSGKKQYQASYLTLFDTVTYISGMAESEEAFLAQAREIHDQLLTARYVRDLPWSDIARMMGRSESHVRGKLAYAALVELHGAMPPQMREVPKAVED